MHVGVFLTKEVSANVQVCLPHARGGVSHVPNLASLYGMSSPCTWGCFCHALSGRFYCIVFPMHVGVFLKEKIEDAQTEGLPHARGGVSLLSVPATSICKSSHARGGVSI